MPGEVTAGLRRDPVGLREVLFQSITAMAPAADRGVPGRLGHVFVQALVPPLLLLRLGLAFDFVTKPTPRCRTPVRWPASGRRPEWSCSWCRCDVAPSAWPRPRVFISKKTPPPVSPTPGTEPYHDDRPPHPHRPPRTG